MLSIGNVLLPSSESDVSASIVDQYRLYHVGRLIHIDRDRWEPIQRYRERVRYVVSRIGRAELVELVEYSRVHINKLYLGTAYPEGVEAKYKTLA